MKISKEQQLRLEGMKFALEVAEKNGIDGLRQECKARGTHLIPVGRMEKEVDKFSMLVKEEMVDTMMIMWCMTLHDELGFGKERLQRVLNTFMLKVNCIGGGYCSWQDNIAVLEEECKMKFKIRNFQELSEDIKIGKRSIG